MGFEAHITEGRLHIRADAGNLLELIGLIEQAVQLGASSAGSQIFIEREGAPHERSDRTV